MNVRALLAVIPLGLVAAEPDRPARIRPTEQTYGHTQIATGTPLARGAVRPTRPRAEAFLAAQHPVEGPPAARVRESYRTDGDVDIPTQLHVLFFARARPVRIQVTVHTHGKSLAERWQEHINKLFTAFDRDGNGSLNRYEVEHIFPMSGMQNMFHGEQYYRSGESGPRLGDLDQDGDSQVSLDELTSYYREVASDLIRPRPTPFLTGSNDSATSALFAKLDQDRDDSLSEQELRAAEKVLLALDGNEDECITAQEVLATAPVQQPAQVAAMTADRPRKTGDGGPRFVQQDMEIYHAQLPGDVVKRIIKRYDKNSDSLLSRNEISFAPADFKRLDTDTDNKLSAAELDHWRTGSPDAVVSMELGETPETCKASASPPVGTSWPKDTAVRQIVPGRLVLRIGSQTVEFTATAQPAGLRKRRMREGATADFPQGMKAVTDRDLVGPQHQFLRVIFFDADFNGDGTLTREEFNRYFDLQQSTTELALSLSHAVRTPNLFQILDDNLDDKLGVRELRTAWDRMSVLEPTGTDAVTRAILQPNGALRLTSAAYAFYDPTLDPRSGMGQANPSPQNTPLWFRKMDRNSDGDISRREFLGGSDDFEMLDADHDDLIALAEAIAYEKMVRPKKSDKKNPKPKSK